MQIHGPRTKGKLAQTPLPLQTTQQANRHVPLSDFSLGVGGLSRHPVTWGDPEAEQILGNKMLIQPATQAVTDSPVH